MGSEKSSSRLVRGLMRFFLPALALAGSYALVLALRATPITILDPIAALALPPSAWLMASHVAIMSSFFVVSITNRVYGPAYAFAQVVIVWGLTGLGLLLGHSPFSAFGQARQPIDSAFLGALAGAHLVNILVFDAMRGHPWWRAPLLSGLTAATALPAIEWLAAHDTRIFTPEITLLDAMVKAVLAIALLLPYAVLRPITRPRDGFGGY